MAQAPRPRRDNPHSARSSSDVDVLIGNALKMKRRLLGLSQQELADKLGVTFQQIQKYENGTNRITASRLNQAAEVFGVSITDFFANVPSNSKAKSNSGTDGKAARMSDGRAPDDDCAALISAFSELDDPRARRCLLEMAELLSVRAARKL